MKIHLDGQDIFNVGIDIYIIHITHNVNIYTKPINITSYFIVRLYK